MYQQPRKALHGNLARSFCHMRTITCATIMLPAPTALLHTCRSDLNTAGNMLPSQLTDDSDVYFISQATRELCTAAVVCVCSLNHGFSLARLTCLGLLLEHSLCTAILHAMHKEARKRVRVDILSRTHPVRTPTLPSSLQHPPTPLVCFSTLIAGCIACAYLLAIDRIPLQILPERATSTS